VIPLLTEADSFVNLREDISLHTVKNMNNVIKADPRLSKLSNKLIERYPVVGSVRAVGEVLNKPYKYDQSALPYTSE
jgi:transposase-like protein